MKRFISLIASALLCLGFILPAFADASGPMDYSFTAVVTAAEGTDLLTADWGINESVKFSKYTHLQQGAKLEVVGSYERDGITYASVRYGMGEFYVNMSDIASEKTTVGKDESVKYASPFSIIVLNPNGIKLYRGPSPAFESIKTIPYGTTVKCLYGASEQTFNSTYSYVDYEGSSGWIYSYQDGGSKDFAIIPGGTDSNRILTLNDKIKLYSAPDEKSDVVVDSIAKDTELTYDYRIQKTDETGGSIYYHTAYKESEGWVILKDTTKMNGLAVGINSAILFTKSFEAYKEPKKSSKSAAKTNRYEYYYADMQHVIYSDDEDKAPVEWYRVNIGSNFFWVNLQDDSVSYAMLQSAVDNTANATLNCFSKPDLESDLIASLQSGDEFKVLASVTLDDVDWMYCSVNSQGVWIQDVPYTYTFKSLGSDMGYNDFCRLTGKESQIIQIAETVPFEEPETDVTEKTTEETSEQTTVTAPIPKEIKMSVKALYALVIGEALLIAAAAGAFIIYIKKKESKRLAESLNKTEETSDKKASVKTDEKNTDNQDNTDNETVTEDGKDQKDSSNEEKNN